MAVFVTKQIGLRTFTFIVGEYDPVTHETITGVVLRGDDNPTSEDFQESLLAAYETVGVLKMLSEALSIAVSPFCTEKDIRGWDDIKLMRLDNNLRVLLSDQDLWNISDDERIPLTQLFKRVDTEFWRRTQQTKATVVGRKISEGYVYLIQSPTKAYKIGRTRNPNNRLKTFGVLLPFEVAFICLIHTDDMVGLERQLHLKFELKRINGEWFALDPEDVEYIKGLAT